MRVREEILNNEMVIMLGRAFELNGSELNLYVDQMLMAVAGNLVQITAIGRTISVQIEENVIGKYKKTELVIVGYGISSNTRIKFVFYSNKDENRLEVRPMPDGQESISKIDLKNERDKVIKDMGMMDKWPCREVTVRSLWGV